MSPPISSPPPDRSHLGPLRGATFFLALAFGALTALPASGGESAIPKGWLAFCTANASFCAKSRPAELGASEREKVASVNRRVNASIVPQADMRKVSADYWHLTAPQGAGDCKSYALTKRLLLSWEGIPTGAMRLATAHVPGAPSGEDHVLLLVRIGGISYVLDNLTDALVPAASVPYRWRSIQREGDPWQWMVLTGAPA